MQFFLHQQTTSAFLASILAGATFGCYWKKAVYKSQTSVRPFATQDKCFQTAYPCGLYQMMASLLQFKFNSRIDPDACFKTKPKKELNLALPATIPR